MASGVLYSTYPGRIHTPFHFERMPTSAKRGSGGEGGRGGAGRGGQMGSGEG
ncbi:hypothetical protein EX30DRAFT_343103 [Ascodesmis nigricans]|uniref:Uncharacterized protein n=1 Tax=Ascodesmis nigricans TaxID=341454 RepID=A0A4S2MN45_9PEZI|nr:hypothetical protein EX30DRAFT_343103 [Ascodesmis nigricans]